MQTWFQVEAVNAPSLTTEFNLYYARTEEYTWQALLTVEEGGFEIHVSSFEVDMGGDGTERLMSRARIDAERWVRDHLDLQTSTEKRPCQS